MLIAFYNFLFLFIIGYSKLDLDTFHRQTVIKVYLLYWCIIFNWLMSYYIINVWITVDLYIIDIINVRFNLISLIMVFIVLLVSSFVIFNSIDYLSIMDSSLFMIYVSLFQLTMITFVLSHSILLIFQFII